MSFLEERRSVLDARSHMLGRSFGRASWKFWPFPLWAVWGLSTVDGEEQLLGLGLEWGQSGFVLDRETQEKRNSQRASELAEIFLKLDQTKNPSQVECSLATVSCVFLLKIDKRCAMPHTGDVLELVILLSKSMRKPENRCWT